MKVLLTATVIGLSSAMSFAEPTTQPAQATPINATPINATPINAIPVPPARPAPFKPSHVAVFPFRELAGEARVPWISKAVQESLGVEVSRTRGLTNVNMTGDGEIALPQALQQASSAGADTAIVGSYQFAGTGDIRLTAQILEAASGRTIAGLKASGSVRDLFTLEDQLSAQMRTALVPPAPRPHAVAADNSAIFNGQFSTLPPGQLVTFSPPVYTQSIRNYYYNYNTYDLSAAAAYGWGGYGYGYGYGFGGPIVIVNSPVRNIAPSTPTGSRIAPHTPFRPSGNGRFSPYNSAGWNASGASVR